MILPPFSSSALATTSLVSLPSAPRFLSSPTVTPSESARTRANTLLFSRIDLSSSPCSTPLPIACANCVIDDAASAALMPATRVDARNTSVMPSASRVLPPISLMAGVRRVNAACTSCVGTCIFCASWNKSSCTALTSPALSVNCCRRAVACLASSPMVTNAFMAAMAVEIASSGSSADLIARPRACAPVAAPSMPLFAASIARLYVCASIAPDEYKALSFLISACSFSAGVRVASNTFLASAAVCCSSALVCAVSFFRPPRLTENPLLNSACTCANDSRSDAFMLATVCWIFSVVAFTCPSAPDRPDPRPEASAVILTLIVSSLAIACPLFCICLIWRGYALRD